MARRPGCEDYEPSQDFLEQQPGDNPQAIGEFVRAYREGTMKYRCTPASAPTRRTPMAKGKFSVVGYFEDFTPASARGQEVYADGPFVVVRMPGNGGWRVEVMGGQCPIMSDSSIHALASKAGFEEPRVRDLSDAEELCKFLNGCVRDGRILRKGSHWFAPTGV